MSVKDAVSKERPLKAMNSTKDEELDWILGDVEDVHENDLPQHENDRTRNSVKNVTVRKTDVAEQQLETIFNDVERRNKELQELLEAVEMSRDDNSSDKDSTELGDDEEFELLMNDIEHGDYFSPKKERENDLRTFGRRDAHHLSRKITASEEELDNLVAELLQF